MTDNYQERRAQFVYEAVRQSSMAAGAEIVPEAWGSRDDDFRDQFIAAVDRQCSAERNITAEKSHTEWLFAHLKMGWTYGAERNPFAKTHPNMVPYYELPLIEKNKSKIFLRVCAIARDFLPDSDEAEQAAVNTGGDSCSMES